MDKQAQIKKIIDIINNSCDREGIAKRCPERIAFALAEAGYINGAGFVEWLKAKVISNRDYPHLAVTLLCDDTREELSEFIDKALQEYLKG